jgi:hypothetical protein
VFLKKAKTTLCVPLGLYLDQNRFIHPRGWTRDNLCICIARELQRQRSVAKQRGSVPDENTSACTQACLGRGRRRVAALRGFEGFVADLVETLNLQTYGSNTVVVRLRDCSLAHGRFRVDTTASWAEYKYLCMKRDPFPFRLLRIRKS